MTKKTNVGRVKSSNLVGRGRRIHVQGIEWAYRVGRGGNVIAYSEKGERKLSNAWTIKGWTDPETFARGQWKKTSDGMVTPRDIEKWLSPPNRGIDGK